MNVNNKITLKKKSESRKGVKFSPETIRKMSDAKKGKKLHPDVLAQLVERNKKPVAMLDYEGNLKSSKLNSFFEYSSISHMLVLSL